MPRPKSDRPAYCRHKRTGRGYVTIDGQQRTLPGAYGSQESRDAYDRLVGTWLASGRTLPPAAETGAAPTGPTVSMIALAFWRHVQAFHVDADGKPTGEGTNFKYALRPLRRLRPSRSRLGRSTRTSRRSSGLRLKFANTSTA